MSQHDTARLFVAVDPPADVCRELAAWARLALAARERRSRVRLLAPETMHVTLCFLGARPTGEIDALAAAIDRCPAEQLTLAIGAPLWLPPRNPRAVALDVLDDDRALTRLHTRVSERLASAIDWTPERRRFRAHVTVARLGRGVSAGQSPLPPTPPLAFSPRELVLYRSWLSPDGARYDAIATRALDASAASSEPSSSPSSSSPDDAGGPERAQAGDAPSSFGRAPSSHSGDEPSSQA